MTAATPTESANWRSSIDSAALATAADTVPGALAPTRGRDRALARKAAEFDCLAPFYDALAWMATVGRIGWLYHRVATMAARALPKKDTAPPPGARSRAHTKALDVCCGTGGVARCLADRFDRVVGIDLSRGMLRRARRTRPAPNLEYRLADALDPRAVGGRVDAITCAFGLHELPPAARGRLFQRAASWLRPRGRLVICDYAVPRSRIGRLLARIYGLYAERRHFKSYLHDDLEGLAAAAGLRLVSRAKAALGAVRLLVFEPAAPPGAHGARLLYSDRGERV